MAQSISQEAIAVTGQVGAQAASRYAGATISGAPTTGSFLVGDYVVDQTGGIWICTVAGSPGTWVRGGFPINENVAGKNFVINGNMDIWQRGAGPFYTASGAIYSVDQWTYTQGASGGTGTMNLTMNQSTNVPSGSSAKYSLLTTITGAYSGTLVEVASRQKYEAQHVRPLQGLPVTVSFWYYSNVSGSHGVRIGFDTNNSGTFTNNSSYAFNYPTINTWQYVTQTFTNLIGFSMGTQNDNAFSAFLDIGPRVGGTQGQTTVTSGNTWSLAQVQMEAGNTATPFSRAGGTYWGEYQLCLPYYEQYNSEFVGRPDQIDVANRPEFIVTYYNKRTAPTITVTNASNIVWNSLTSSSGANTTSFGGAYLGTYSHSADLFFNTASGIVAYGMYAPVTAQGSYSINISAEL